MSKLKEEKRKKIKLKFKLKDNFKELNKSSKGMTLIALVIAIIIVLLILAVGILIVMLTEENKGSIETEISKNLSQIEDTKPFLPDGAEVIEGNLEKGVVIKDSNGNEWTWIEVPKSIYENTEYNGGKAPKNSDDYAKIEITMQNYAKNYRSKCADTWDSEKQNGFSSEEEYNNYKKQMLKSVYENGGFYIGKYETGTNILRTSSNEELTPPVIQEGRCPLF